MSPALQKYDFFLLIQPGKQEINTRKVSFCDWNAYKAYIADLNQKPVSLKKDDSDKSSEIEENKKDSNSTPVYPNKSNTAKI